MRPKAWLEFEVAETTFVADRWVVGGRCFHLPLYLDDEFTAVYRYLPPAPGHEGETTERTAAEPVALRIRSIELFGRTIPVLFPGCGGRLTLEGDAGSVARRDVLAAPMDEVTARRRVRDEQVATWGRPTKGRTRS